MTTDYSYALAFLAGLFGSFHCAGMCGGLVSAFFLKIGGKGGLLSYFNYHAGRIAVYSLIGTAAAAVGFTIGTAGGFRNAQQALQLIAGGVIIVIGLDLLGLLPWRLPFEKLSTGPINNLLKKAGRYGPATGALFGGLLNGLMPCNLLYAVIFEAAATGNPLKGALLSAAFGLGTLPSMLSVSFFLNKLGGQARGMLFRLAAVTIILMGSMTMCKGTGIGGHKGTAGHSQVRQVGR